MLVGRRWQATVWDASIIAFAVVHFSTRRHLYGSNITDVNTCTRFPMTLLYKMQTGIRFYYSIFADEVWLLILLLVFILVVLPLLITHICIFDIKLFIYRYFCWTNVPTKWFSDTRACISNVIFFSSFTFFLLHSVIKMYYYLMELMCEERARFRGDNRSLFHYSNLLFMTTNVLYFFSFFLFRWIFCSCFVCLYMYSVCSV